MSSAPASLAAADVSSPASFAVVIYTIDDTAAAAAVGTRGEDEVEEEDEDEDEFDNAIGKSILLGHF
jgi:hypothetical protein